MSRVLYWIVYWILTFYLKIFRGLKIYGRENIPKKGPVIVAGNHVSNLDPIVLAVAMTRITRFMAKKELFKIGPFGWLLKQVGAFPVNRGRADMEAMRTSLKILKNNEVLGLFPEGTRVKGTNLGKAHLGIVMLALKAKVPILPCGIINTGTKKNPIVVRIGKPIYLDKYYNTKLDKQQMENIGNIIMKKIGQQLSLGV